MHLNDGHLSLCPHGDDPMLCERGACDEFDDEIYLEDY